MVLVRFVAAQGLLSGGVLGASSCFDESVGAYSLEWKAEGKTFFDDLHFSTGSPATNGAAVYLDRDAAFSNKVIEAHSNHAILRTGQRTGNWQRHSAKVQTKKYWDRFLTVLKFNHVPYGAGVWPAFWSNGQGKWPDSGEVDYLEWANHEQAKISMHVGKSNPCSLHSAEVNKCAAFPDQNREDYDCFTYYDKVDASNLHLGCGPTSDKAHHTGAWWAANPGVMAIERTDDYVKVFYIPEAQLPDDLNSDAPDPNSWDRWVISYFPFTASEKRSPGSCPNAANVLKPQQFILNIELCGDWAGYTWWPSDSDPDADTWRHKKNSGQCTLNHYAGGRDCCSQYLAQNKMENYLSEQAYFNVSYMKIYQQGPAPPSPAPIPPAPSPPGKCDLMPGQACQGADIKDAGVVSSEGACCDACAATTGCKAWTWNKHIDQHCWVKNNCDKASTRAEVISGTLNDDPAPTPSPPVCSVMSGTACSGNDIGDAGKVSSQDECCDQCVATTGCKAWTWNKNIDQHCWLKTSCNSYTRKDVISGTLDDVDLIV